MIAILGVRGAEENWRIVFKANKAFLIQSKMREHRERNAATAALSATRASAKRGQGTTLSGITGVVEAADDMEPNYCVVSGLTVGPANRSFKTINDGLSCTAKVPKGKRSSKSKDEHQEKERRRQHHAKEKRPISTGVAQI